jgi:hypothetical protein
MIVLCRIPKFLCVLYEFSAPFALLLSKVPLKAGSQRTNEPQGTLKKNGLEFASIFPRMAYKLLKKNKE